MSTMQTWRYNNGVGLNPTPTEGIGDYMHTTLNLLFSLGLMFLWFAELCLGNEETGIVLEPQEWEPLESPYYSKFLESEFGLLMSAQGFGSKLSLIQYLAEYFQLGESFRYFRQEANSGSPFNLHYDISAFMRVAPFSSFKYSPYASVTLGYDTWHTSGVASSSGKIGYIFGLDIHLTDFFGINLAHHELGFTGDTPKYYWGRQVEGKKFGYDEVMFQFRLDDRLL